MFTQIYVSWLILCGMLGKNILLAIIRQHQEIFHFNWPDSMESYFFYKIPNDGVIYRVSLLA